MKKEFLEEVRQFLKKQNATILETSLDGPLTPLLQQKLENIPNKPQILFEWKNQKMLGFISNKNELFHSKDGRDKTGGDWPIFQFLYHIEAKTNLDVVLIIKEDRTNNWFFRQLNQLPKPELGWRDRCLAKGYIREEAKKVDCVSCWRKHPLTCSKCTKKRQPTAVWDAKEFTYKILIQNRLV